MSLAQACGGVLGGKRGDGGGGGLSGEGGGGTEGSGGEGGRKGGGGTPGGGVGDKSGRQRVQALHLHRTQLATKSPVVHHARHASYDKSLVMLLLQVRGGVLGGGEGGGGVCGGGDGEAGGSIGDGGAAGTRQAPHALHLQRAQLAGMADGGGGGVGGAGGGRQKPHALHLQRMQFAATLFGHQDRHAS
eukprot:1784383-Prymnesium_polylepis.1